MFSLFLANMKAVKLGTEGISQFIFPNGESAFFFFFLAEDVLYQGSIQISFFNSKSNHVIRCNKIMSKVTIDVGLLWVVLYQSAHSEIRSIVYLDFNLNETFPSVFNEIALF